MARWADVCGDVPDFAARVQAGRAIDVPNDDPDDDSHTFRIDVREVVLTHLNDAGNRLVIESWHPGRGIEVVERE